MAVRHRNDHNRKVRLLFENLNGEGHIWFVRSDLRCRPDVTRRQQCHPQKLQSHSIGIEGEIGLAATRLHMLELPTRSKGVDTRDVLGAGDGLHGENDARC